jgi:predicted acetyltransferase
MLLRSLELGDELEAIQAHEELAADNFTFLLDYKSGMLWSEYVAFINHLKEGEQLPEGYVPSNFLVADQDSQIIGRTSIRYKLRNLFSS